MTGTNDSFSIVKIVTALVLGYGCAAAWVIYADVVYNNNVPLEAFEFHGLYPISLGLSAIIAVLLFDRNLKCFAFKKFKPEYLFFALLIASAVILLPFLVNLALQITGINPTPKFDPGLMAIGIPVLIVLGIGEELMWRGILYAELSKKFSFAKTSFIVGIFWAAWHYPVIIHTKFLYADRPLWFALTGLTLMVWSASFVFNYLRKISGSIFPCVLLHAFINYIVFVLVEPLEKAQSTNSVYFMNDIGIFYVLTFMIAAFLVYRRVKVENI